MFQRRCSRRLACTRWRCGRWASTATTRRSLRNTHEVARAYCPSSSRRKSQCAWPREHNQNTNFVVDFSDEWFHIPNLNSQLLSATSSKRAQSARNIDSSVFCQSNFAFYYWIALLEHFLCAILSPPINNLSRKKIKYFKNRKFSWVFLLPQKRYKFLYRVE